MCRNRTGTNQFKTKENLFFYSKINQLLAPFPNEQNLIKNNILNLQTKTFWISLQKMTSEPKRRKKLNQPKSSSLKLWFRYRPPCWTSLEEGAVCVGPKTGWLKSKPLGAWPPELATLGPQSSGILVQGGGCLEAVWLVVGRGWSRGGHVVELQRLLPHRSVGPFWKSRGLAVCQRFWKRRCWTVSKLS